MNISLFSAFAPYFRWIQLLLLCLTLLAFGIGCSSEKSQPEITAQKGLDDSRQTEKKQPVSAVPQGLWRQGFENETVGKEYSGWKLFPLAPGGKLGNEQPIISDKGVLEGSKALNLDFTSGSHFGMSVALPAVKDGWAKLTIPLCIRGNNKPRFGFEIRSINPVKRLAVIGVAEDNFEALSTDFKAKTSLGECRKNTWYRINIWLPSRPNAKSENRSLFRIDEKKKDGTWETIGQASMPVDYSTGNGIELMLTSYPGKKNFSVMLDSLSLEQTDPGKDNFSGIIKPTFTGETSKPHFNVFIPDETVLLKFTGAYLPDTPLKLNVKIVDEHFNLIENKTLEITLEKGSFQTTINAPNTALGFYRVYATLSNGLSLPRIGSRPAGFLTYAIVPDPATRPYLRSSEARFGMQGGFCGKVNPLPYIGVHWVNSGPHWSYAEPNYSGEFAKKRKILRDQGRIGPPVDPKATREWEWCKVVKNGKEEPWPVYPFFSLYNPPKWAIVKGSKVGSTGILTEDGEKAWQAYCEEIARSKVEDFPNLEEHFYQITWEPNWFNGAPEQFVTIYRIAADAIRAIDKKAVISGPAKAGIGRYGMDQEEQWFKKGFGKYLDVYNVHPYTGIPAEKANYTGSIRALKDYINKNAGKSLPICGTEQGLLTDEDVDKELLQAQGLIRAHIISIGEGFRFNFGFYIHDYGTKSPGAELGYGYFYNLREGGKFGTDSIGPKPIVPAMAAMTYLVDGTKSLGSIDWLGETVRGYAFERDGKITLALWDIGDKASSVSFNTGSESVDLYDFMGNRKEIKTPGGSVSLKLTQSPVYVRNVSPAVWGANAPKPLSIENTIVTAAPGAELTVSGTVREIYGRKLNGKLTVFSEKLGGISLSQNISLSAGASVPFSFPVPIPKDTAVGFYPLKVTVTDNNRTNYAEGFVKLSVETPVIIRTILPGPLAKYSPDLLTLDGIRLVMSETMDKTATGTVWASGASGITGRTGFTLRPAAETDVPVKITPLMIEPGKIYPLDIKLETNAGYSSACRSMFGCIAATWLKNPPEIDGNLSEWKTLPPIQLKYKSDGAQDDFNAQLRTAYNSKGIYLACDVTDDVFSQNFSGADIAKGDSLLVAVNLDPGKPLQHTSNAFADKMNNPKYMVIGFALTQRGVEAYRFDSSRPDSRPTGEVSTQAGHYASVPTTIKRLGKSTIYEIFLPWGTLMAWPLPRPDDTIGIAVVVNDRDAAGEKHLKRLKLFDGIYPETDIGKLGNMILMKGE